jgi:hypothetical protein
LIIAMGAFAIGMIISSSAIINIGGKDET